MKRAVFLASVIVALVMVGPASAAIVLDFSTGDAGAGGAIVVVNSTSAHTASGAASAVPIDLLTVTGTAGYDGAYDVIGTATGSLESNVGAFTFDTAAGPGQFATVVGGITCAGLLAPNLACSATDITNGKVLVPLGTTLLSTTGAFTGVNVTGFASVQFFAPDSKSSLLLAALGGLANQWGLGAFTLAPGTGNNFTSVSTDIANTQVPEPTSILLLGTVLFGVTHLIRRRARKA